MFIINALKYESEWNIYDFKTLHRHTDIHKIEQKILKECSDGNEVRGGQIELEHPFNMM